MNNVFFEKIRNTKYPYVIAEIGANHNGDIDLAKKMIDVAVDCGCDAVKFQSWTPSSLISKSEYEKNQKYTDSAKKHFGSLKEMVEKYYLKEEQHFELKDYCKIKNVDFCSSPFSNKEVDLLVKLDVPFIKVASLDINNLRFLKHIASTNKTVILSTGMSSLAEIDNAVKTIERQGNFQIVLLHCISIYPPEYVDIHLNNISMLKQAFGYPVGFSDHTIGFSIPLASVALGACIIEKHFTLDRSMPGWDHEISANPEEMKIIVSESRNIVDSLGSYCRIVSAAEENKKHKFRRSLVYVSNFKCGEIISDNCLSEKRPGSGIAPDKIEFIIGRKLRKDVLQDDLVNLNDFE